MSYDPAELEQRVSEIATAASWDQAELVRSILHLVAAWDGDIGEPGEALIVGLEAMADIEREIDVQISRPN